MNRDTVIRLAQEAELNAHGLVIDRLARFAALVAAHEREQIAKMFDAAPKLVPSTQFPNGSCFICGFNSEKAAAAIRSRT